MNPAAAPEPKAATGSETSPGFISHHQMQALLTHGHARPLSRLITDYVRYGHQWWIADPPGWTHVDDDQLITTLNRHHTWAEGGLYLGGGT